MFPYLSLCSDGVSLKTSVCFLSVSQLEERFEIRKQILEDVQSKRLETFCLSVDLDAQSLTCFFLICTLSFHFQFRARWS